MSRRASSSSVYICWCLAFTLCLTCLLRDILAGAGDPAHPQREHRQAASVTVRLLQSEIFSPALCDDDLQVLEVPTPLKEGVAEQQVYLLGSCAAAGGAPPATAVLPDTPTARAAAVATAPSMSFWRADAATGAAPIDILPRFAASVCAASHVHNARLSSCAGGSGSGCCVIRCHSGSRTQPQQSLRSALNLTSCSSITVSVLPGMPAAGN